MNLEPYLIDFESLQVGDEVYYIRKGMTRIRAKTTTTITLIGGCICFPCGRTSREDINPSIYKSNPFEAPESVSEYPKMMRVRNPASRENTRRMIIGEYKGKYFGHTNYLTEDTEAELRTGGSMYVWENAEDIPIPTPEPKTVLSRLDIARLAGCTVEDLEILED